MQNIFDKTIADTILSRIERLQPDSKALWGKMNVAQMLSHLQASVESAMGEVRLKRVFIGFLFGKIAKRQLVNEKPFAKNLPTDGSFIRKGDHDFETEKVKLITVFKRLIAAGETGLTTMSHPFFGKMTTAEWGSLLAKHFDHHLRQFGA